VLQHRIQNWVERVKEAAYERWQRCGGGEIRMEAGISLHEMCLLRMYRKGSTTADDKFHWRW